MPVDETSHAHIERTATCLGRVVMVCSQLEHDLTMAIAQIMELNEVQERSLVRPMATSTKLALVNRLAKDYLARAPLKQVTTLTAKIKDATGKRNDLVHARFGHENKKVSVLSYSGPDRISGRATYWTLPALEALVAEMVALRRELVALAPLFPKLQQAPKMRRSAANTPSDS
jgi:hypothetical protein